MHFDDQEVDRALRGMISGLGLLVPRRVRCFSLRLTVRSVKKEPAKRGHFENSSFIYCIPVQSIFNPFFILNWFGMLYVLDIFFVTITTSRIYHLHTANRHGGVVVVLFNTVSVSSDAMNKNDICDLRLVASLFLPCCENVYLGNSWLLPKEIVK